MLSNLVSQFNYPFSPPPGYFKEINSIISKFIWNDKCPRIKLTTLQHTNIAGGLAVPNFELYYWSFQLKALHNWVDPQSTVSWRVIEADKVKPNRLQDILFTDTGKKGDNYKFGPVVANSIKIWKTVERRIGGPFKFCNSTPLWHDFNFVIFWMLCCVMCKKKKKKKTVNKNFFFYPFIKTAFVPE